VGSQSRAPRAPFINPTGQTVRQIARVGLGGLYVRIQLSNEFGDKPLTIGAAHVAVAAGAGAATQPDTDRTPPSAAVGKSPSAGRARAERSDRPEGHSDDLAGGEPLRRPGARRDHCAQLRQQTVYLAPNDATAAPDLPGATTMTMR